MNKSGEDALVFLLKSTERFPSLVKTKRRGEYRNYKQKKELKRWDKLYKVMKKLKSNFTYFDGTISFTKYNSDYFSELNSNNYNSVTPTLSL